MKNVIFSSYINAWSVKKGLKKINHDLYTIDNNTRVIPYINKDEINNYDRLFFTEESNLISYVNKQSNFFQPRNLDISLIDDKLLFANYLKSIGETPIPSRKLQSIENNYPFYFKCRHSWQQGIKLPRGFIVNNKREFQHVENKIANNKWEKEWFFHQKLLNLETKNNISTSGYFDYQNEKRNIIIVTKKTLGSTSSMSTGVLVETMKDPRNLINRTSHILSELEYTGPFELEFLYEKVDDTYYVLELNPRFWMQHGIFIDVYNNALIKRYLQIDEKEDWYENGIPPFKHIIWVDTVHIFLSVLRFRFKSLFALLKLKGGKIYYPSIPIAIVYLFEKVKNIITKK